MDARHDSSEHSENNNNNNEELEVVAVDQPQATLLELQLRQHRARSRLKVLSEERRQAQQGYHYYYSAWARFDSQVKTQQVLVVRHERALEALAIQLETNARLQNKHTRKTDELAAEKEELERLCRHKREMCQKSNEQSTKVDQLSDEIGNLQQELASLEKQIVESKEKAYLEQCDVFQQKLHRLPANAPEEVANLYETGTKLLTAVQHDYRASKRSSNTAFDLSAHTMILKSAGELLENPGNKNLQSEMMYMHDKRFSGRYKIGRAVMGLLLSFAGLAAIAAGFVLAPATGGLSLAGSFVGIGVFSLGSGMLSSSGRTGVHKKAEKFGMASVQAPERGLQEDRRADQLVLAR